MSARTDENAAQVGSSPGPAAPSPAANPPPAALFGLLVVPFGIVVGYSDNALSYVLRERGATPGLVGVVVALVGLPHAWKVLWAPALDAGTPRTHWFVASVLVAASALGLASLLLPAHVEAAADAQRLELFVALVAVAQAGAATSSAAVDALMATSLPDARKGSAAGWSMAGNLGGTGLGGALTVWVTEHVASAWCMASILFAAVAIFALPIVRLHEPREPHPSKGLSVVAELRAIGRALGGDLLRTLSSREGWTGLLICLTPVGTGAATKLFGALADDYVADPAAREHVVLVVNGLAGGLVSALGCLLGGYLADRMNRRVLYVLAGLATALSAVGFACAPAGALWFTLGTLAYQLGNGVAYAAFAAFVLEMIGHGRAVATKYQLFVGASNFAISYVAALDGQGGEWGAAHLGSRGVARGVLGMDALLTVGGAVLLGILFTTLARRGGRGGPKAHLA